VENCPWYVEIAWNFYHGTMSSLQGKTLENIPGFSTFNIPWMPGITWKIVQLIPWSLERKKKNPGLQNRIHACKSSGPLFKNLAIKAAIKIQIINLMAKI
jgi:hypothetical protein